MKTVQVLSLVLGLSLQVFAGVKPGELKLNKGPAVIASYTNFYNDSDLSANCQVYSDKTAMFLMEGIVPARKPVQIILSEKEYYRILSAVKKETAALESPKEFANFSGVPMSQEGDGQMGALYYGKLGNHLRPEKDLVNIPTVNSKSELIKIIREICGYGDDL